MMKLLRVKLLLLVAAILGYSSCTEVNYELGTGLLPGSTETTVKLDTLSLKSFTHRTDSIVSDWWASTSPLGSYIDPVWGRTTGSTVYQIVPSSNAFTSLDTLWGKDPVIDSVFLMLTHYATVGDTTASNVLDIYSMNKPLPMHYDSSYYSNFDAESYIDQSPVASITVDMNTSKYELPIEFATHYLDTLNHVYLYDSLFVERYPGIYIKPRTQVVNGGLLSQISNESSYILVYYHNSDEDGADTTSMTFNLSSRGINKVINILDNDTSYADPVVGIENDYIGENVENAPITYVRPFANLTTKVELIDSEIDRIKAIVEAEGYSKVAVNNATIVIPLADPKAGSMNYAPSFLGLYYDYSTNEDSPDYWYGLSESDDTFDGSLSRSNGEYRMNITSYVQDRFNGTAQSNILEIAPIYGDEISDSGVALNGASAENPIELVLTYTLIK